MYTAWTETHLTTADNVDWIRRMSLKAISLSQYKLSCRVSFVAALLSVVDAMVKPRQRITSQRNLVFVYEESVESNSEGNMTSKLP